MASCASRASRRPCQVNCPVVVLGPGGGGGGGGGGGLRRGWAEKVVLRGCGRGQLRL